jgi:hypothetical protein
MKLKLSTGALLAAILLIAPHQTRAQYLHPRVSAKQTSIRNVVIVPARVEVVRQSMKGPESMAAESDLLSRRVTQLITEALQAKQIKASITVPGAGEADTQKKYALSDLQARYDALLPRMMKKPKDVKKGRFSLGDEVLNLNLDQSTDAIIFVRGQGQKLTSGKKAFSLLTFSLDLPYLLLTVGIVDAHTGEVLVFATPLAVTDVTSPNEKPLRQAIEKSFKKLPVAAP